MRKFLPLTLVAFSLLGVRAGAEVRLEGSFEAREACEAYRSIRNETNPGSIRIDPGTIYPLVAKNKPEATHYLIEIASAQPQRRWVAIRCGEARDPSGGSIGSGSGPATGGGLGRPDFILAVSWQPAFCESGAGQGKTECDTQSETRFDASHFTLHGLWPQPRSRSHCRVPPDLVTLDDNRDWDRLPEPDLAPGTRRELERVMPGTMSRLDRHEWIKHGTCFGEPPEAYFARSIVLVNQLNESRARELFASNIGASITAAEIRRAFDDSFGPGAGDRVRVECSRDGRRTLIDELTIGLGGEIGPDPSLAAAIAAAPPTSDRGCPDGLVDQVGQQ